MLCPAVQKFRAVVNISLIEFLLFLPIPPQMVSFCFYHPFSELSLGGGGRTEAPRNKIQHWSPRHGAHPQLKKKARTHCSVGGSSSVGDTIGGTNPKAHKIKIRRPTSALPKALQFYILQHNCFPAVLLCSVIFKKLFAIMHFQCNA